MRFQRGNAEKKFSKTCRIVCYGHHNKARNNRFWLNVAVVMRGGYVLSFVLGYLDTPILFCVMALPCAHVCASRAYARSRTICARRVLRVWKSQKFFITPNKTTPPPCAGGRACAWHARPCNGGITPDFEPSLPKKSSFFRLPKSSYIVKRCFFHFLHLL